MLSKMKRNNKGFTLIELMIVVAIIGILAAIAIPQFSSYRARAQDSAAKSTLKNLATAQEDYYVQEDMYTNVIGNLSTSGYVPDDDVTVAIATADVDSWSATAAHDSRVAAGAAGTFTYSSSAGGLQ